MAIKPMTQALNERIDRFTDALEKAQGDKITEKDTIDNVIKVLTKSIKYLEKYLELIVDKPLLTNAIEKAQLLYAKEGLDVNSSIYSLIISKSFSIERLELLEVIRTEVELPEYLADINFGEVGNMLSIHNRMELYYFYILINLTFLVLSLEEFAPEMVGDLYTGVMYKLNPGLHSALNLFIGLKIDDLTASVSAFNVKYKFTSTIWNKFMYNMINFNDFQECIDMLNDIKTNVDGIINQEAFIGSNVIINESAIEVGMKTERKETRNFIEKEDNVIQVNFSKKE